MSKFGEMLNYVKGVKEKRKAFYEQQRLERESKVRLDELELKFHRVDDVALPFPSLYALRWLEKRIGLDNINIEDYDHLAAVVFILENQSAVDEIERMAEPEVEAAIKRQMAEINAAQHFKYVLCVREMLAMIKKKQLGQQAEILEQALSILKGSGFSADGDSPSPPSPSGTASP